MRISRVGHRLKASAVVAATLAATLGGIAVANASVPPPDGGGGATDCQPMTYIYASGSTITFNGWTRCTASAGFELQIAYGQSGGTTKYSNIKACRGALAGGSSSAQLSCGINGVTATMTDTKSGLQKWCVNTLIIKSNPAGSRTWSNPGCISH